MRRMPGGSCGLPPSSGSSEGPVTKDFPLLVDPGARRLPCAHHALACAEEIKSFADPHIAKIQRNAVRSWLRLEPRREVLVFGDEPGVKEMPEVALRRVPDRLGAIDVTVRIRDMAKSAERRTAGVVNFLS
jgi:hypothetical protein